jgi:hypothetical protein
VCVRGPRVFACVGEVAVVVVVVVCQTRVVRTLMLSSIQWPVRLAGAMGSIFATDGLGLSVGYPLTMNGAFLVNLLLTFFVYREIQGRRNILLFLGAVSGATAFVASMRSMQAECSRMHLLSAWPAVRPLRLTGGAAAMLHDAFAGCFGWMLQSAVGDVCGGWCGRLLVVPPHTACCCARHPRDCF